MAKSKLDNEGGMKGSYWLLLEFMNIKLGS
jgi:hypothetical protein